MTGDHRPRDDGTPGFDRVTPTYRPAQVEKPAPCQSGCPNCGDIRGWIGIVAQREQLGMSLDAALARAWSMITEVNPFPAVLGRVCPHPCETHCNRSELDEPLAINAMERFLGDWALEAGLPLTAVDESRQPEWIGVIGAGPSGLSFACQMARRGYPVTIYEARDQAGGMLRYGIPDYRLPPAILDAEIRRILDLGVELKLNTVVGRDFTLDDLRYRHGSLYLGIGAQKGLSLGIPGEDGPGVWTGTDYLARVNRGESVLLGDRVVVVGGGNTAVDAARTARRAGAEVTLLYRRTREEMPAIAREVDEALEEGIELILLAAPVGIERLPGGAVAGVEVQRMELGPPDASGRRSPLPIRGSEFLLPVAAVIAAVSQVPALDGLEDLASPDDRFLSPDHGMWNAGLLAGGDALGLGIAANAIVQGRRAAEELHARLRGFPRPEPGAESGPRPAIPAGRVHLDSRPATPAARPDRAPGAQRIASPRSEVSGTITLEEFLREIERCFSCGSCFGCGQCAMFCTLGGFTTLTEARPGMYYTLTLDRCQECGKCVEVCPCGFLEVT